MAYHGSGSAGVHDLTRCVPVRFLQTKTPWYDGVPSVQQCPIAPGSSFTYRFKAELYGTTWSVFVFWKRFEVSRLANLIFRLGTTRITLHRWVTELRIVFIG